MKDYKLPQSTTLEEEYIERVERAAKMHGFTRSKFIRYCVNRCVESYERGGLTDLPFLFNEARPPRHTVTFTLEFPMIERAHKIAAELGITYSSFIRECVLQGLYLHEGVNNGKD